MDHHQQDTDKMDTEIEKEILEEKEKLEKSLEAKEFWARQREELERWENRKAQPREIWRPTKEELAYVEKIEKEKEKAAPVKAYPMPRVSIGTKPGFSGGHLRSVVVVPSSNPGGTGNSSGMRAPKRKNEWKLNLGKKKKTDGRPSTEHAHNSNGELVVRTALIEEFNGRTVREMTSMVSNCPCCYKVFPPFTPMDEILCSRCWEKGHLPRRCPAPAPVDTPEDPNLFDLDTVSSEEKAALTKILQDMRKKK